MKVSKHLNYLRARGMVEVQSEANWRVYCLPAKPSPELAAHLACLRECSKGDSLLKHDNLRLAKVRARLKQEQTAPEVVYSEIPAMPVPAKKQSAKAAPVSGKQPLDNTAIIPDDSFLLIPQRSFPL